MGDRLLPDTFVIGAPRSGTTHLYRHLGSHPDIFMSENKEPWFYNFDSAAGEYVGPGDGQGVRDRGEYEALFDDAGGSRRAGEASTLYLASHVAPAAIRRDSPNAHLIAVLRNPVDRAFSNYNQHRWQGRETLGFIEALQAGPGRVAEGWAPFWDYDQMSRYGQHLTRWYETFAPSQILVVAFTELTSNPQSVMDRVYRFLSVDPSVPLDPNAQTNPAGSPRYPVLHRFLRGSSTVKKTLKRLVPGRLRGATRARIDRANMERAELDPALRARLDQAFQPDLELAAELSGGDLLRWIGPRS